MPITTPTFRIFVSSTFEDLIAERDALQRDVFPKLRALCEQHGARFQAIDLRWGIRDEAALDQKTMEICLREIERCRETTIKPNFIVLLGDRYGWQPLPAHIPVSEFDPRAVAGEWYRLDENAAPPEYVLQPRIGRFTEPAAWRRIEEELGPALAEAAGRAGVAGEALRKYQESATHQEIVCGLGNTEEDRRFVFGFFRRRTRATDPRLDGVKNLIPNRTEFTSIAELCEAALRQLTAVIENQARRFHSRAPLETEIESHNQFAADRARVFHGRKRELMAIAEYLAGGERRPLVVHGAAGSGKSALMAKASLAVDRAIRRFIGASPDSLSGHILLTGLCRQIAPDQNLPTGFAQLAQAFQERLARAGPLVVFVDALNQIPAQDPARDLTWLPRELPAGVKLVVSTTADAERLPLGIPLTIGPMSEEEAGDALDQWLGEASRRLRAWQRTKVLEKFADCSLPLYLKFAAEEARTWTSYATDVECRLGDGVEGIIDTLFARLSEDTAHGSVLVSRALGYLAAARYGLAEDEAMDILSADEAVWEDFNLHKHHEVRNRRLPTVVWSRLRFDLDAYLAEHATPGGVVIGFFHRQLADLAAVRFLTADDLRDRHRALARYFGPIHPRSDGSYSRRDIRTAAELPYHQIRAEYWRDLESTLSDLQFGETKIACGMLHDFIRDCDQALSVHATDAIRGIRTALARSMPALSRMPELTLQTLYNTLVWSTPIPPALADALNRARVALDSRPFWISTEAPIPVAEAKVVFDCYSTRQYLLTANGLIAGLSDSGELDIRRIDGGEIFSKRRTKAVSATAIALPSSGYPLAWMDTGGTVRVEDTTSTLRCRPGEPNLVHSRLGVIAVTAEGSLVAWDPVGNACTVLARELPKPVSVLRMTAPEVLLCIAGSREQEATIFDLTGGPTSRCPVPSSAEVIDADFDPQTRRILFLTLDSKLHLVELEGHRKLAELGYESDPLVRVQGLPTRCALARPAHTCAFFATQRGQVARWDWAGNVVTRLSDYATVANPKRLAMFETLPTSGQLFLSTGTAASVCNESPDEPGLTRHGGSVSACCFTHSGRLASASFSEGILCWSSTDLQKLSTHVNRSMTALGAGFRPDEIVLGDRQGRVWSLEPGDEVPNRRVPVPVVLSEGVLSVCVVDGERVVLAGKSGRIVRVPLYEGTTSHVLSKATGYREQQFVLPAGSPDEFWSLRRESDGGQHTVLSLTLQDGREVVALRSNSYFVDMAVSADGATVCLAGASLRVFRRSRVGVDEMFHSKTACDRVAFLGNRLLVVVFEGLRLEIRRIEDNLPRVGAFLCPAPVESLATLLPHLAAGLRSGGLLSLRLNGAEIVH